MDVRDQGRYPVQQCTGGHHLRPQHIAAVQFVPQRQHVLGGHPHVPYQHHAVGDHQAPEHLGVEKVHVRVHQPGHQVEPLSLDDLCTRGYVDCFRRPNRLDTLAQHEDRLAGNCGTLFHIDNGHIHDHIAVRSYR